MDKALLSKARLDAAGVGAIFRPRDVLHLGVSFRQLQGLVAEMDDQARRLDPVYPETNLRFHLLIFDACPHRVLKTMAADLARKSARLRTVSYMPGYLATSQAQHRQVVEALERRDGQLAETLVREHIAHAGMLLWQYAMEHSKDRL